MPKIFGNSLILIAAAVVVLSLMAGYVKLTQFESADQDKIKLSVAEDIIWFWDQADLWVDYSGAEGEAVQVEQAPGPLVFLIDTSGSMSESDLSEAKRAILDMQLNVGNQKGLPAISIVNFADNAKVVIPLTKDTGELKNALTNMQRDVGGGTAFIVGLDKVLEVIDNSPPATIVMLTDGHAGESSAVLRTYYENVWQPKGEKKGHVLFMIGIGEGGVNTNSFQELTKDPAHYILAGLDRNAIGGHFLEAARRMGNVFGRNVRLQIHLAEPLWTPYRQDDSQINARSQLNAIDTDDGSYYLPVLFKRPYQWTVSLDPKFGGILSTVADIPTLTYVDKKGVTKEVRGPDGSPKVLAITPWLFFLLLLPLLLYWLAELLAWLRRKPAEPVTLLAAPRVNKTLPPANLPLRPVINTQRIKWTPTLVIGLGGSGREVLTHIKQNMRDSQDEPNTRPVLLAMDVARDEITGANKRIIPGCLADLDDEQQFILPSKSCDLTERIHQTFDKNDPAAALDLLSYKNSTADVLRLSKGTSGQPTLARLALLTDLANGSKSALIQQLQKSLTQWRQIRPEHQTRQIQIIANVDGGVGSGWLTDMLIVLRRLVKEDELKGQAVEIVVILQGKETVRSDKKVGLDAPVLFSELNRLACAGKQMFRHCLAIETDQPELDGMVENRPQDAIYIVPTNTREHNPAVADVAGFLIDQKRRTEVAQTLHGMQAEEVKIRANQGLECYTKVAVQNATYPQSFFEQLQVNRLQQLVVSEQVLFVGLQRQEDELHYKETVPAADLVLGISDVAPPQDGLTLISQLLKGAHDASLWSDNIGIATIVTSIQQIKLNFVDNTNLLLAQRKLGLFGLQQLSLGFSQQIRLQDGISEGGPQLEGMAEQFDAVVKQAVTWMELCHGSATVKANGLTPVLKEQWGMMHTAAVNTKQTREKLDQWAKTSSRLLVSPVVTGQQGFKNSGDEENIQTMLDEQFKNLLKNWLEGAKDQVAELTARCYWQLSMPGLNGEAIGIHLMFRGTQTLRYLPDTDGLAKFSTDLATEAARVLDQADQTHILTLLQQNQQVADDNWFGSFANELKGGLLGEKSHLLVSVPELYQSQGGLKGFRDTLKRTFKDDIAGSTEIVRLHDSNNSTSVSIFQAQPLMQTDTQVKSRSDKTQLAIHRPERLLQEHSKKLAMALGFEHVDLPPATAIALNNLDGLKAFAVLYFDGQININPVSQLWQFNSGNEWQNLTHLPLLGLADAAACFVTQWQSQGVNQSAIQGLKQPVCPDTQTNHFVELLQQQLDQTTPQMEA